MVTGLAVERDTMTGCSPRRADRRAGVAFDEQIVSQIPTEPHDVRLNCILTPDALAMRSRPARGFEMILLANIFAEGAGFLAAGAVLCYLLLALKDRNARKMESVAAQSALEKARREAEAVVRDARLTANEEALKLRLETEQAFAGRRQERAELERRLGERELLINAQLEKVVQVEKGLQEQKGGGAKTGGIFRRATEGTGPPDPNAAGTIADPVTPDRGGGPSAVSEGNRAGSVARRQQGGPAHRG